MHYATLEQVKRYLGLSTLTATQEARVMDFLPWATDLIRAYKGRRYDARVETRHVRRSLQRRERLWRVRLEPASRAADPSAAAG